MKIVAALVISIPAALVLALARDQRPAPRYVDIAAQSGLEFRFHNSATSRKYLIETMGGGIAIFDYDNDGWPDVFFVNGAALGDPQPDGKPPDKSAPEYWNRLYRNNRDGTFTDVTQRAGLEGSGYGMGAATGDYDNDGYPDLLVTTYGGAILYHNNGNGTFSDVTAKSGVRTSGWTTGAGFFDYDRDGCLDLVVARYMEWDFNKGAMFCGTNVPGGRSYCHPDEFPPASDYLFHGNCHGTFTDVSKSSGMGGVKGKALGLAFGDYDDDGFVDISIANDSAPQMLFHNNGNGTFSEVGTQAGVAYTEDGKTFSGMGTVFADIDGDGLPDILTTALPYEYYAFFQNAGRGQFQYASVASALAVSTRPYGGWGIHVFDFDNDGGRDLFLANAHVMDNIEVTQPHLHTAEPPLLLKYTDGRFVDVSQSAGEALAHPWVARGAAFGDLDNDGDIDVVVTDYRAPAHVLRNEGGNLNHWIGLDLRGTRSSRDAIGARVRLTSAAGKNQYAMVSTAGSYLSANDRRVYFGLGSETTVREVQIRWPSGSIQAISAPPADRILKIVEDDSEAPAKRSAGEAQRELQSGLALAREGKNAEAIAAFRAAVGLDPELVEAHFSLGVLLARQGRLGYGEAFTQFLEVLRLHPSDVDAHINISNLLEAGSNMAASVSEMRKALDLAADKSGLYRMLGEKQIRAYLYADAAESFRRAIASGRPDPRAHYGLGLALKHLHQPGDAEAQFEAALRLDPRDPYAHLELGTILAEKGRLEEAIGHLEQAVTSQPKLAEAWFELGGVYRRMAKPEDAAAALRKGLALQPDQTSALYELSSLTKDPRESSGLLARYRHLKARAGETAEAVNYNAQGMQLMDSGRLGKALEAFHRALECDPTFTVAAYNSGVVLAHQGEKSAAMEAFRNAIRIDPGFAPAHRALGLLLENTGDPAGGRQELRAAAMLESSTH